MNILSNLLYNLSSHFKTCSDVILTSNTFKCSKTYGEKDESCLIDTDFQQENILHNFTAFNTFQPDTTLPYAFNSVPMRNIPPYLHKSKSPQEPLLYFYQDNHLCKNIPSVSKMDMYIMNLDWDSLKRNQGVVIGLHQEQDQRILNLANRYTENTCHSYDVSLINLDYNYCRASCNMSLVYLDHMNLSNLCSNSAFDIYRTYLEESYGSHEYLAFCNYNSVYKVCYDGTCPLTSSLVVSDVNKVKFNFQSVISASYFQLKYYTQGQFPDNCYKMEFEPNSTNTGLQGSYQTIKEDDCLTNDNLPNTDCIHYRLYGIEKCPRVFRGPKSPKVKSSNKETIYYQIENYEFSNNCDNQMNKCGNFTIDDKYYVCRCEAGFKCVKFNDTGITFNACEDTTTSVDKDQVTFPWDECGNFARDNKKFVSVCPNDLKCVEFTEGITYNACKNSIDADGRKEITFLDYKTTIYDNNKLNYLLTDLDGDLYTLFYNYKGKFIISGDDRTSEGIFKATSYSGFSSDIIPNSYFGLNQISNDGYECVYLFFNSKKVLSDGELSLDFKFDVGKCDEVKSVLCYFKDTVINIKFIVENDNTMSFDSAIKFCESKSYNYKYTYKTTTNETYYDYRLFTFDAEDLKTLNTYYLYYHSDDLSEDFNDYKTFWVGYRHKQGQFYNIYDYTKLLSFDIIPDDGSTPSCPKTTAGDSHRCGKHCLVIDSESGYYLKEHSCYENADFFICQDSNQSHTLRFTANDYSFQDYSKVNPDQAEAACQCQIHPDDRNYVDFDSKSECLDSENNCWDNTPIYECKNITDADEINSLEDCQSKALDTSTSDLCIAGGCCPYTTYNTVQGEDGEEKLVDEHHCKVYQTKNRCYTKDTSLKVASPLNFFTKVKYNCFNSSTEKCYYNGKSELSVAMYNSMELNESECENENIRYEWDYFNKKCKYYSGCCIGNDLLQTCDNQQSCATSQNTWVDMISMCDYTLFSTSCPNDSPSYIIPDIISEYECTSHNVLKYCWMDQSTDPLDTSAAKKCYKSTWNILVEGVSEEASCLKRNIVPKLYEYSKENSNLFADYLMFRPVAEGSTILTPYLKDAFYCQPTSTSDILENEAGSIYCKESIQNKSMALLTKRVLNSPLFENCRFNLSIFITNLTDYIESQTLGSSITPEQYIDLYVKNLINNGHQSRYVTKCIQYFKMEIKSPNFYYTDRTQFLEFNSYDTLKDEDFNDLNVIYKNVLDEAQNLMFLKDNEGKFILDSNCMKTTIPSYQSYDHYQSQSEIYYDYDEQTYKFNIKTINPYKKLFKTTRNLNIQEIELDISSCNDKSPDDCYEKFETLNAEYGKNIIPKLNENLTNYDVKKVTLPVVAELKEVEIMITSIDIRFMTMSPDWIYAQSLTTDDSKKSVYDDVWRLNTFNKNFVNADNECTNIANYQYKHPESCNSELDIKISDLEETVSSSFTCQNLNNTSDLNSIQLKDYNSFFTKLKSQNPTWNDSYWKVRESKVIRAQIGKEVDYKFNEFAADIISYYDKDEKSNMYILFGECSYSGFSNNLRDICIFKLDEDLSLQYGYAIGGTNMDLYGNTGNKIETEYILDNSVVADEELGYLYFITSTESMKNNALSLMLNRADLYFKGNGIYGSENSCNTYAYKIFDHSDDEIKSIDHKVYSKPIEDQDFYFLSSDCQEYKCTKYKYNYNFSKNIPNADKIDIYDSCSSKDLIFKQLTNNENNYKCLKRFSYSSDTINLEDLGLYIDYLNYTKDFISKQVVNTEFKLFENSYRGVTDDVKTYFSNVNTYCRIMTYQDEYYFLTNYFPKDNQYKETYYQNTINEFKKVIRENIIIKFFYYITVEKKIIEKADLLAMNMDQIIDNFIILPGYSSGKLYFHPGDIHEGIKYIYKWDDASSSCVMDYDKRVKDYLIYLVGRRTTDISVEGDSKCNFILYLKIMMTAYYEKQMYNTCLQCMQLETDCIKVKKNTYFYSEEFKNATSTFKSASEYFDAESTKEWTSYTGSGDQVEYNTDPIFRPYKHSQIVLSENQNLNDEFTFTDTNQNMLKATQDEVNAKIKVNFTSEDKIQSSYMFDRIDKNGEWKSAKILNKKYKEITLDIKYLIYAEDKFTNNASYLNINSVINSNQDYEDLPINSTKQVLDELKIEYSFQAPYENDPHFAYADPDFNNSTKLPTNHTFCWDQVQRRCYQSSTQSVPVKLNNYELTGINYVEACRNKNYSIDAFYYWNTDVCMYSNHFDIDSNCDGKTIDIDGIYQDVNRNRCYKDFIRLDNQDLNELSCNEQNKTYFYVENDSCYESSANLEECGDQTGLYSTYGKCFKNQSIVQTLDTKEECIHKRFKYCYNHDTKQCSMSFFNIDRGDLIQEDNCNQQGYISSQFKIDQINSKKRKISKDFKLHLNTNEFIKLTNLLPPRYFITKQQTAELKLEFIEDENIEWYVCDYTRYKSKSKFIYDNPDVFNYTDDKDLEDPGYINEINAAFQSNNYYDPIDSNDAINLIKWENFDYYPTSYKQFITDRNKFSFQKYISKYSWSKKYLYRYQVDDSYVYKNGIKTSDTSECNTAFAKRYFPSDDSDSNRWEWNYRIKLKIYDRSSYDVANEHVITEDSDSPHFKGTLFSYHTLANSCSDPTTHQFITDETVVSMKDCVSKYNDQTYYSYIQHQCVRFKNPTLVVADDELTCNRMNTIGTLWDNDTSACYEYTGGTYNSYSSPDLSLSQQKSECIGQSLNYSYFWNSIYSKCFTSSSSILIDDSITDEYACLKDNPDSDSYSTQTVNRMWNTSYQKCIVSVFIPISDISLQSLESCERNYANIVTRSHCWDEYTGMCYMGCEFYKSTTTVSNNVYMDKAYTKDRCLGQNSLMFTWDCQYSICMEYSSVDSEEVWSNSIADCKRRNIKEWYWVDVSHGEGKYKCARSAQPTATFTYITDNKKFFEKYSQSSSEYTYEYELDLDRSTSISKKLLPKAMLPPNIEYEYYENKFIKFKNEKRSISTPKTNMSYNAQERYTPVGIRKLIQMGPSQFLSVDKASDFKTLLDRIEKRLNILIKLRIYNFDDIADFKITDLPMYHPRREFDRLNWIQSNQRRYYRTVHHKQSNGQVESQLEFDEQLYLQDMERIIEVEVIDNWCRRTYLYNLDLDMTDPIKIKNLKIYFSCREDLLNGIRKSVIRSKQIKSTLHSGDYYDWLAENLHHHIASTVEATNTSVTYLDLDKTYYNLGHDDFFNTGNTNSIFNMNNSYKESAIFSKNYGKIYNVSENPFQRKICTCENGINMTQLNTTLVNENYTNHNCDDLCTCPAEQLVKDEEFECTGANCTCAKEERLQFELKLNSKVEYDNQYPRTLDRFSYNPKYFNAPSGADSSEKSPSYSIKNTRYGNNFKNVCPFIRQNDFLNRMKESTTFIKDTNTGIWSNRPIGDDSEYKYNKDLDMIYVDEYIYNILETKINDYDLREFKQLDEYKKNLFKENFEKN